MLIIFFLKRQNLTLKDLGYSLNTTKTIYFVGSYLILGLVIYFFGESGLQVTSFNSSGGANSLLPVTSGQRFIWIFACFSAGFCEEFIYRGFALNGLISKGMSKWLALPVSAVSFTLMHGPGTVLFISGSYYIVFFGLLMGGLLLWVKRLWIPMSVHMWYDFLLFYIPFFFTTHFSDRTLSQYTPANAIAYDSTVFNLSRTDSLPDYIGLFDDKNRGGNSNIHAAILKGIDGNNYIHLSGEIVKKGYLGYAEMDIYLSKKNVNTIPVLLDNYKGIEFYAKGNGDIYKLLVASILVKDYNYHFSPFTANRSWEKIQLPFENMKQKSLMGKAVPLNLKTITTVAFVKTIAFVKDGRSDTIDLDIKDIRLYK